MAASRSPSRTTIREPTAWQATAAQRLPHKSMGLCRRADGPRVREAMEPLATPGKAEPVRPIRSTARAALPRRALAAAVAVPGGAEALAAKGAAVAEQALRSQASTARSI